jgi:hypothetical protein
MIREDDELQAGSGRRLGNDFWRAPAVRPVRMDVDDAGHGAVIVGGERDLPWRRVDGRQNDNGGHDGRRCLCETLYHASAILQLGVGSNRVGLVGPFPRELGLRAAEVTERRGLRIDRTAQVEFFVDTARRELEVRPHQLGEPLFGNLPVPSVCTITDTDRRRQSLRELHERAVGQSGRDDVLAMAAPCSRRNDRPSWIFAEKAPASMRRGAAVGVR